MLEEINFCISTPSLLSGRKVTDGLDEFGEAEHPLFEPLSQDREAALAICEGVMDILSSLFNVNGRELRSARRCGLAVARVRQIGMYISHVTLRLNVTMVGVGFGRNKSTVLHACHLVEDMRDDEEVNSHLLRIEKIVIAAFKASRHLRP